jgi:ABC-type phosphate transport system substrate-binding protein
VFTGKGSMPKSFASDAEVVKYVSTTKGAIGYVSAAADVASAKKIAVK